MSINPISLNQQIQSLTKTQAPDNEVTPSEAQQSFSALLKNAIDTVNNAQVQSDIMTEKLAKGENVELHDVMIASQKASITLSATMEIRNKVIEAYQEIMRMSV